jgi:SAM-dependent methyltransferase
MRTLGSPGKDAMYLLYRLVSPVFDPVRAYRGIIGYFRFIRDYAAYRRTDPSVAIRFRDLFPILDEKRSETPFDAQYYYQSLWAFGHISAAKPDLHVDIASPHTFSGFVATVTESHFVDIQPIPADYPNLKVIRGSILSLPYPDGSLGSVSSLHVIEHIGLGRYGDPIDPAGPEKAARELARVLRPGGTLYLSTTIGRPRLCFNAHRVFAPTDIPAMFPGLELTGFAAVTDERTFIAHIKPSDLMTAHYACGMFRFTKPLHA